MKAWIGNLLEFWFWKLEDIIFQHSIRNKTYTRSDIMELLKLPLSHDTGLKMIWYYYVIKLPYHHLRSRCLGVKVTNIVHTSKWEDTKIWKIQKYKYFYRVFFETNRLFSPSLLSIGSYKCQFHSIPHNF